MNKLQPNNFPEFFKAIYAFDPFPWQRMLVERIAEKGWPEGIDLPTASGKTACLDAAVFLMALEENEGRLLEGSSARRRVFFVVDRRIVVDEAYNRAKKLANELEKATTGIVKQVADRLRDLAGGNTPLIASRLRGGTVRDDRWRLSPAQPAIVTGTVDQIGSRMLFRSYGAGLQSAPIEAALTACDSLLLLDEAHCAVPFMQTGRAVQRYAGGSWIDGKPFVSALTFSILSATLPADVTDIFPIPEEREKALRHDLLDKRINASKPAELVETKDVKGRDEKFIAEVLRQAHQAVKGGRRRIAIMVNRVARASEIAGQLRAIAIGGNSKLDADVVLMTGRMRPIDRDTLVDRWSPLLKSGSKLMPDRPIVLVTTQCLEVGADFSFDALITECASLDALRQRFGRLNRLGDLETTYAAVLVRKPDLGAKAEDPIYGTALKETWNWLNDNAVAVEKSKTFDFGIAKVDEALASCDAERSELLSRLNAPSPDAPVLLPAHVDLLCQTAPKPTPDPDVAIYLHGPQRYAPEVRVVFRADLINSDRADWREAWCDTVSLLPPLTGESLSVPLWLIRKWLAGELQPQDTDELGDVEGQSHKEESGDHLAKQPFLIWRSRKEGVVSHQPNAIRPNDSVIVPADSAFAAQLESAHAFCRLPDMPLDIAEQASWQGKGRPILRLLDSTLEQAGLTEVQPVKQLVTCLRDEDRGADELIEQLSHLAKYSPENESEAVLLPQWLKEAAKHFASKRPHVLRHPAGGVVLFGQLCNKHGKELPMPELDFGDEVDALSAMDQPVPLNMHTQHVVTRAGAWGQRCLPDTFAATLKTAAELHDLGKADPRFQIVLHGDEVQAAVDIENGNLLAKSDGLYRSPAEKRQLREAAGLPDGFRHEMLSMQLAEYVPKQLPDSLELRDLVLHLVASHHGHARPFAPVVIDDELPSVAVDSLTLTGGDREKLIPPHRLDSRVAERFWKLTRRFGWWGLAYFEAILRLADQNASAFEAAEIALATKELEE